ncbi:laccase 9 [Coprinopsis marcescibilis]|uniref:Laccase 9 n=1 Tax=Coprinopsis marcescibilis TaxID=230819 RepID=A0A5C3KKH4_COPMA|nr:laccase 9 [Coprinopsis marcescibilis]
MLSSPALLSLAFLAVALCFRSVDGQVLGPVDEMTISNMDASPDGRLRPVIAVNRQYPAPLIRARKGDNFRINVVNNLTDPTMLRQTSVHWHGIFQRQTAWADGPEGVTQCPVAQFGQSFQYAFSAGEEAGTYWYHSHFGTQYCDGLRGPIVIYDDNDPHQNLYQVDDENTVITLADWYHVQAPTLGTGPAQSNATLINGKGRRPGGPPTEIAVVNVEQTKTYRMRLISMSCDPDYTFSIDNHNLTIIEADGQSTEPYTVQQLRIFAGQRYSFVLNANQPNGSYWIRARPNLGFNMLNQFDSGGINSAILRYVDPSTPETDPTTSPHVNPVVFKEENLHALLSPAAPGGPNPAPEDIEKVDIDFGFGRVTPARWDINGSVWAAPDSPVMVQILNHVPPSEVVPKESIRILPRNKVVEVTIHGVGIAGPHPFHMHGHAFSVVKSANSSILNYDNPVRRDVVETGLNGNTTIIRFTTDNPGPWFFHCHIEFHLVGGLGMVFVERPDEIETNSPPPPSWSQLCETYDNLPAEATSVQIVPPIVTTL